MMLVSRTPLRVSFFGGGTDYPEYFRRSPGAVVGMAIDKYVYIAALRITSSLSYKYRLAYSKVEMVQEAGEIEHPVVPAVLSHMELGEPLDMSVMADLPARSGLGSSSSFTVGLLNLASALKGRRMTKLDLARGAVFVEREILHENVGVQDQYHAAFGGLNRFDFHGDRVRISPVQMTAACQAALTASLFLIDTRVTRFASVAVAEQVERTKSGSIDRDLSHLLTLADQAVEVLEGSNPEELLRDFGAMLHEGWETKKRLSSKISTPEIDALYAAARSAGALGGKLCGAGSGGFLLMLVPPQAQRTFLNTLAHVNITPVGLDTQGTVIVTG